MFHLTIKTPYAEVFTGEVESLSLSLEDGDMQVFEDHASVTGSLIFSPVVVEQKDKEEIFLARHGVFTFDNENNTASLLTSYCTKKAEVDYKTVKEYAEFITKQLEEGHDLSEFKLFYLKGEKVALEKQIEESEEA